MNIKDIEDRVKSIDGCQRDDEEAHSREDNLYYDFIEYVASSSGHDGAKLREMAKAVLETKDINFHRWYA